MIFKPLKKKIHELAEDGSFLNDQTLRRDNLLLLLSIMLMAFVVPIIRSEIIQGWAFEILMSCIIIFGVTSLKFRKTKFIQLSYFGFLTFIFLWINHFTEYEIIKLVAFLILITFIIYITYSMIAHVSRSEKVTKIMILNAMNSYLLLGLISAYLFAVVEVLYNSFFSVTDQTIFNNIADPSFHDFIYFSYVTLTTLGYGDITPAIPFAKSLAMLVSITGQLYLTILVAMLVGKYLSQSKSEKDSL